MLTNRISLLNYFGVGRQPKENRQHVFRAVAVLIVFFVAKVALAQQYSITDLGDLPGGRDISGAHAINDEGLILGASFERANNLWNAEHGVIWRDGVMTKVNDLVSEDRPITVTGINDSGMIIGKRRLTEIGMSEPILVDGDTVVELSQFEGIPSGRIGTSYDINNHGEISVEITSSYLTADRTFVEVGFSPYAINDNGTLAGLSEWAPEEIRRLIIWEDGEAIEIGDPDRSYRPHFELNNLGQFATLVGPVGERAQPRLSQSDAVYWDGNEMVDLTQLTGEKLFPRGINDSSVIVGGTIGSILRPNNTDPFASDAFIWDDAEGFRLLEPLLDESGDGWRLDFAADINNTGMIVGTGINPRGREHGFLLTPIISCNPDSMGDLDGDGLVQFSDFLILSANFGTEVSSHELGDINCDGSVDFPDFLTLSANFGSEVSPQAVPEPESPSLFCFGIAALALSRCRRRNVSEVRQ